jgi:hypothetical protein
MRRRSVSVVPRSGPAKNRPRRAVQEAATRVQRRSRAQPGLVHDDDLAAAARQLGERGLERHRGREVERVEQRVALFG